MFKYLDSIAKLATDVLGPCLVYTLSKGLVDTTIELFKNYSKYQFEKSFDNYLMANYNFNQVVGNLGTILMGVIALSIISYTSGITIKESVKDLINYMKK